MMKFLIFLTGMCVYVLGADNNVADFNQIPPPSQGSKTDSDIILTLSPYAQMLHSLLSADGILEALYNTTLTPCDARVSFQYGSLIFSQGLDVVNPMELHITVGVQAGKAFSRTLYSLNYFRAFSRTLEEYLQKFLTPETYSSIARRHHEILKASFTAYGFPVDAISALHLVISSNVKLFKELGKPSRFDVLRVLLRAYHELGGLRESVEYIYREIEQI